MRLSDFTVSRYHIPSLKDIKDGCMYFGDKEIAITASKLQGLLSLDILWDVGLHSIDFFHKYNPWSWISSSWDVNLLYYSPFHHNTVQRGDLIILKSHDYSHTEVVQYLWSGYYMIKDIGRLPMITKMSLINSYNYHKWVIRNPDMTYSQWFQDFYYGLYNSGLLQIHNRNGNDDYPFTWTQRLYDTYVDEIQSIYDSFDLQQAHNTTLSMNKREIISSHDWISLHKNRNSRSFYRDANYSFSYVKDSAFESSLSEIAIISFLPVSGKIIEIVQIGWNKQYVGEDFLTYWTRIIDHMKSYFRDLWFEQLRILRWDKNIGYIHPKQQFLGNNFSLEKHQKTMLLRYNATPHRKWWFTKPDERYSYFDL